MGIIANRPIIGGVQHRECSTCHRILPEQKPYFSTNGLNARGERPFKAKCNDCQNEYQQQFYTNKGSRGLVPTDTKIVAIVEGLDVQVGWHGDAKYWPVKPLAHLCKRGLTAWPNLYAALTASEQWASVVIPVIMTGADGKRYKMACLPWDRWPAFWLEFGGNNTQSQSVRATAQRALALVFGDTAESNRAAAVAVNDGRVQVSMWQPEVERGMRRVVQEEVRAVLAAENDRLESRTIRHEVSIDRPVDGRVYIAEESRKVLQSSTSMDVLRRLDRGWRYLFISESGRGEDERLGEYKKKRGYGVPVPEKRKVILSDSRKKLERCLHANLPEGVWKVPGKRDEFMAAPEAFDRLMALPSYIGSIDIPRVKHWILCQTIFDVV